MGAAVTGDSPRGMQQPRGNGQVSRVAAVARRLLCGAVIVMASASSASEVVTVGQPQMRCGEDPQCVNRLHPDIPMVVEANAGQTIVFRTRNALDIDLAAYAKGRPEPIKLGTAHALAGPVRIRGARRGDAIAVTLLNIAPGAHGITLVGGFAFAADLSGAEHQVLWQLDRRYARSDTLAGVRIPNASFPGVITTLPGDRELKTILAREAALADAGGVVYGPDPDDATPVEVCGPDAPTAAECLRTIPPREHGGNMDIRYQGVGATVYLPCFVDGCGLALGDLHFAQGDGEVAGMAIEMDADVTVITEIIKQGAQRYPTPHYEGPSNLLDIPSRRFYATTGIPVKAADEVPPEMAYLDSAKVGRLENLSMDINLAARNALDAMLDYIVSTYGYSRAEAHIIASVAVDLRIGQLVDAPNVGVTAILPLDIFEQRPKTEQK